MALGGVATGNMKAKDALRVQGSMTYSGLRPMERDWGETQHCRVTYKETKASGTIFLKSVLLTYCECPHLCTFVLLGPLPFARPLDDNSARPQRRSSQPSPREAFLKPLNSFNIYFLGTYYVPRTMLATQTARILTCSCSPHVHTSIGPAAGRASPGGRDHIFPPIDTSVCACDFCTHLGSF